jgi:hypothetical protein
VTDEKKNPETSPIRELNVTEVSVSTTGVYTAPHDTGKAWSATSLRLGIASLALAPLFGLGILIALPSLVVGHRARAREPQGALQSMIGLWLTYVALVVGTAVLVFVALPLTVAFLISMGYILSD